MNLRKIVKDAKQFFGIFFILTLILPYSALARTEAVYNQPDQFYIGENGNLELNINRDSNLHQDNQIINTDNLPKYLPGELLVKFKSNSAVTLPRGETSASINRTNFTSSDVRSANAKYQVTEVKKVITSAQQVPDTLSTVYALKYSSDEPIETIVEEYKKLSRDVEYAEPNYIYYTNYVPNDPLYEQQEHHQAIFSEEAWEVEDGNANTVVAVIDTGVDLNHPDLRANLVAGYDFVDLSNEDLDWFANNRYGLVEGEDYQQRDNEPMDKNGHGTHVAGIVAAVANNEIGIAGVCPNCRVMPVRNGFVIASGGYYYGFMLSQASADAIVWAADHGADVINMSWGGYTESQIITNALNYAHERGVILVAAAGNSNSSALHYPSASNHVISVAANNGESSEYKASFSNYGESVDISAPGVNILSLKGNGTVICRGEAIINNEYCRASGTSMASPIVAGIAALVKAWNNNLNPDQISRQIIGSANHFAPENFSDGFAWPFGSGSADSLRALTLNPRPNINVNNLIIEEVNGNDNGYFNSGETINLFLELKNWWVGSNGATTTISFANNGNGVINLNRNIVYFGPIGEGETAINELPFEFAIDENIGDGSSVVSVVLNVNIETTERYSFVYNYFSIIQRNGILAHGQLKDGWPVYTRFNSNTSPTVADMDGDGSKEIILPTDHSGDIWESMTPELTELAFQYLSHNRQIYIWEADGGILNGWPQDINVLYGNNPISAVDINDDGNLELVYFFWPSRDEHSRLFLRTFDGSLIDNWPVVFPEMFPINPLQIFDFNNDGLYNITINGLRNGFYLYNQRGELVNTTIFGLRNVSSVGDLDNDPNMELLSKGSVGDFIMVNNIENNLHYPNPPVIRISNTVIKNFILADLDADGIDEIIVSGLNEFNRKYVLFISDPNNEDLSGLLTELDEPISKPVVGDIDNDGRLEIISVSNNLNHAPFVHAWKLDGSEVEGFPVEVPLFYNDIENGDIGQAFSDPTIADINEDGYQEIIFPVANIGRQDFVFDSFVIAIDHNGQVINNEVWPIIPDNNGFPLSPVNASVAVDDLDGDGSLDLVFSVARYSEEFPFLLYGAGSVYAYDLGVRDTGHNDWPQYRHDAQHSGNFGFYLERQEKILPLPQNVIMLLLNQVNAAILWPDIHSWTYPLNEDLLASEVFETVNDELIEVISPKGNRYTPEENGIGRLTPGAVYQVNMSRVAVLDLERFINTRPEDLPRQINLKAGDNEIVYPLEEAMAIEDALAGIIDNVVLVKNLAGDFYVPAYDYNHIGELQSYYKYIIKVEEDVVLDFDQIGEGQRLAPRHQEQDEEYDPNNQNQDFDKDGLNNIQEQQYSTDPQNADSDSDGYPDSTEIANGYDPLKGGEAKLVQVKEEIKQETAKTETKQEPVASKPIPESTSQIIEVIFNPESNIQDYDSDGISNFQEKELGTDPKKADTDSDGYNDGKEVMYNTDPLIFGLVKKQVELITTAPESTTNKTTTPEVLTVPETTTKVIVPETTTTPTTTEPIVEPVPESTSQIIEVIFNPESNIQDYDFDGLSNAQELKFGTDPKNADTDGDGYNDGKEIMYNTDPLIYNLVKK